MKKFLFTIITLALGVTQMNAQSLSIDNIDIPENGQAKVAFKYETGGKTIVQYGFKIELPEGLSWVMDTENESNPAVTFEDGKGFNLNYLDGNFSFLPSSPTAQVKGTEGTLIVMTLKADDTAKQDDTFTVKVTNVLFSEKDSEGHLLDVPLGDFEFTVTVVENIVTLDENSTTAPEAAENVNVQVLRKITGGNWSTICLPFSMTDEQIVTAFGEGAEWADISNHDIVEDGEDIASITINFETATTFEANHPYIIKVKNDIESFKLQGVTIEPEEDPCYEMDNGKTGSRRVVYRGMYGTYVAETYVPEFALFISKNLFWYAKANTTKMKAFRAWLDLGGDIVTAVENGSAKFNFVVDGEATTIDGMGYQRVVEGVYDLSGRKIKLENGDLNKLQKGVYIIDGKKVTIK